MNQHIGAARRPPYIRWPAIIFSLFLRRYFLHLPILYFLFRHHLEVLYQGRFGTVIIVFVVQSVVQILIRGAFLRKCVLPVGLAK